MEAENLDVLKYLFEGPDFCDDLKLDINTRIFVRE
jgi:hypothetical protein